MGKHKDPVRKLFDCVPQPAGIGKAKGDTFMCRYCSWKLAHENVTRLKEHTRTCKKWPPALKNIIPDSSTPLDEDADDDGLRSPSPSPSLSSSTGSTENSVRGDNFSPPSRIRPLPSPSLAANKKSTLMNFLDHMSPSEQEQSAAAFSRAAYATNSPFGIFQHPLFVEAFRLLRPAFRPPKKDAVGGRFLNAEYEKVMFSSKQKVQDSMHVAVCSDGWKNIKGQGLLNFVILTPDPVFYKAIELKDVREDSDFIANETIKVIQEVGPEKVVIVITDNVSYNKVAWEIIIVKYPHIAAVGCAAHSLNLLMTDIVKLPSLAKMVGMAKSVYKGIHNCRRALGFFEIEQQRLYGKNSCTLKIPAATRFSGTVIMFVSLHQNKDAIMSTVLQGTTETNPKDEAEKKKFYISKKVRAIGLNESFWSRLSGWIGALQPIAQAIAIVEADDVYLSDVPQLSHDIAVKTVNALQESPRLQKLVPQVKRLIQDRREFACKDVHFAANLLDPRFKGVNLKTEERIAGSEYISKLCNLLQYSEEKKISVLSNLTEFRGNGGIWANESIRESYHNVPPALWWKANCQDEPIMPIAVRLLTLAPTSASCERSWSDFGRTHTKIRNRLKNPKVEKLVAVHMNSRYALPSYLLKPVRKVKTYSRPITLGAGTAQGEGGDTSASDASGGEGEEEEEEVWSASSESDGDESDDGSWIENDTDQEEDEDKDDDVGVGRDLDDLFNPIVPEDFPVQEERADEAEAEATRRSARKRLNPNRNDVEDESSSRKLRSRAKK